MPFRPLVVDFSPLIIARGWPGSEATVSIGFSIGLVFHFMLAIVMNLIRFLMLSSCFSLYAHAVETKTPELWIEKSFVIIASKSDYSDAKKIAEESIKKLQLKRNYRNLEPHAKTGLTFPKVTCDKEQGSYPCYLARGRYDDGVYVSIEYSNAFKDFAQGYYIVVVASDSKESKLVTRTLKKAKRSFPDAYSKTAKVWMGCIH